MRKLDTQDYRQIGSILRAHQSSIPAFVDAFVWAKERIGTIENDLENLSQISGGSRNRQQIAEILSEVNSTHEGARTFLHLMRFLDDELSANPGPVIAAATAHTAHDGVTYKIVRVELFPGANETRSSALSQFGSVRTYAKRHLPIPITTTRDIDIVVDWSLSPESTIGVALSNARVSGSIMMDSMEYDDSEIGLNVFSVESGFRVDCDTYDRGIASFRSAVKAAEISKSAVLLLPELTIPCEVIDDAAQLAEIFSAEYPIIAVVGLTHRHDGSSNWKNQVAIIGKGGKLVRLIDKLTRFNLGKSWECHSTGDKIVVFPTAIGLLTIAICRDFFSPSTRTQYEASGATLFLVPSLSKKTAPHRTAAKSFLNSQLATSFVSNRWHLRVQEEPTVAGDGGFLLVPGRQLSINGGEVQLAKDGQELVVSSGRVVYGMGLE